MASERQQLELRQDSSTWRSLGKRSEKKSILPLILRDSFLFDIRGLTAILSPFY
jgi:hypothetical protein